jgi:hypothetical protein
MLGVVVAGALVVRTGTIGAQGRIVRGVVIDANEKPVAAVTVQAPGAKSIATDDSGRFQVQLPSRGRVALDARRVGFIPSRFGLASGGDTDITIVMLPAAQELTPVNVTAAEVDLALERSGFNQRQRERTRGTNTGYFITAAEIERRHPPYLTQMFDGLPGLQLCRTSKGTVCGLLGTQLVPNQSTDPRVAKYIPCSITVFLDGFRLNVVESTRVVDIDGIVPPATVAGVEYYPSGNRVPPQYQMLNGSCGLVLIWTKRG